MNEVTLQLPKTLRRNLEMLAEQEAVPLSQYIVYILSRQISEGNTVRVVPNEEAAGQKAAFDSLLKMWGKVPPDEADRILDGREPTEPEAELDAEVVRRLKSKIADSKSRRI